VSTHEMRKAVLLCIHFRRGACVADLFSLSAQEAAPSKEPPEDPIEALRFYGLLEGCESLFGDVGGGDASSVPRSTLSSTLGRREEQLLSVRSSYCHARGAYRRVLLAAPSFDPSTIKSIASAHMGSSHRAVFFIFISSP
jgi:hypothetical protein